jgi:hypothetical protein
MKLQIPITSELARGRLPAGVAARLRSLLNKQSAGISLTRVERREAEGLVDIAEFISLLKMRIRRAQKSVTR